MYIFVIHSIIETDYIYRPLYMIGLVFQIPVTPLSQYLSLTLKGVGL